MRRYSPSAANMKMELRKVHIERDATIVSNIQSLGLPSSKSFMNKNVTMSVSITHNEYIRASCEYQICTGEKAKRIEEKRAIFLFINSSAIL
jgi:hypothetical protein